MHQPHEVFELCRPVPAISAEAGDFLVVESGGQWLVLLCRVLSPDSLDQINVEDIRRVDPRRITTPLSISDDTIHQRM